MVSVADQLSSGYSNALFGPRRQSSLSGLVTCLAIENIETVDIGILEQHPWASVPGIVDFVPSLTPHVSAPQLFRKTPAV